MWTHILGFMISPGNVSKRYLYMNFLQCELFFHFHKKYFFWVRDSLQIVQSEWNIVKLGNAAHFGMCKRARLKDLYMEANKSGWFSSKTIPLMTNKIIEVIEYTKTHWSIWNPVLNLFIKPSMERELDYTNPLLDNYRTATHDAIMVYGFIPANAESGALKAKFTIEDGLR